MGEKDIAEKILMDYNDVFADIVNVCIFNGVEKIKQNDLEKATVYSQYKADDGKLHQEERDIAKYWKRKQMTIAMYGIENQSKVDKNMPFRIIAYDGASYRTQLLAKAKRIAPVVSFVLYFGTDTRWQGYKSIKELVDFPEELEEYVNDYKINVIDVAWLTEEQLRMFKSDFGIVANFFVQRRKNKQYIPDDKREFQHIDEVLKLLSVMTGDDSYEEILYNKVENKKEKVKSMCEVADRLKTMGRNAGIEVGRKEGIEVGRKEGIEVGRKEGIEVGRKEGRISTMIDMIFLLLKRKGTLSKQEENVIRNEKDETILESWVILASAAETVEQFLSEM